MARNIKIELELPDFEKELNISVTLKKDGENVTCSSHPSEVKTDIYPSREVPQTYRPATPSTGGGFGGGGNMMNVNF